MDSYLAILPITRHLVHILSYIQVHCNTAPQLGSIFSYFHNPTNSSGATTTKCTKLQNVQNVHPKNKCTHSKLCFNPHEILGTAAFLLKSNLSFLSVYCSLFSNVESIFYIKFMMEENNPIVLNCIRKRETSYLTDNRPGSLKMNIDLIVNNPCPYSPANPTPQYMQKGLINYQVINTVFEAYVGVTRCCYKTEPSF